MIVSVFAKHAGQNKRCLKTSLIVFFVVTIFPLRPAVFIFRQTALGASGWSCLDLPGPSLFLLGLREVWILRRRSDSCHPCILEERRRSRKSSSQQRTMNTGWGSVVWAKGRGKNRRYASSRAQEQPGVLSAPEIQLAWSSGSSWRRPYVERGDGEQVLPVDAPRQALSKACGPGPALTC